MFFHQFIKFSRQFVFGVLILSLLSCSGSGSLRTTSLANLETQQLNQSISGTVQLGLQVTVRRFY